MKVGELKELLENYSDDDTINMRCYGDDDEYEYEMEKIERVDGINILFL